MLIFSGVFAVAYEFDILCSWPDGFLDRERRWEGRHLVYHRMTMRDFYHSGRSVGYNCSKHECDRNPDSFGTVLVHGAYAVLPL